MNLEVVPQTYSQCWRQNSEIQGLSSSKWIERESEGTYLEPTFAYKCTVFYLIVFSFRTAGLARMLNKAKPAVLRISRESCEASREQKSAWRGGCGGVR